MDLEINALKKYDQHYRATIDWLLQSFLREGGSSAFFMPFKGWSDPYPETTGYIIPTLIEAGNRLQNSEPIIAAENAGEWLLSIQSKDGFWLGGTHPPRKSAAPSIFNTGQILKGLCALYRRSEDHKWLEAASRGAVWLASSVNDQGVWQSGHYQKDYQPTYYTRVAWPMLEVWSLTKETTIKDAAIRVLDWSRGMRNDNGTFRNWGFKPDAPAFTHTIAYTLRGLIESSRFLGDWERYGALTVDALDHLYRQAELRNGALPGTFDENWTSDNSFVCLTGCVQTAICLLKLHTVQSDLRLINAAAKLVDFVCDSQSLNGRKTAAGAVAGSKPLWGRYLRFRYPNWAAKFHADALLELSDSIRKEHASIR